MLLDVIDPEAPDAPDRIDRACRTNGFFRVPLGVIDADVADRAWQAAGDLFDLDPRHHADIVFPEPGYPYGFSPFGLERLASSRGEDSRPDLKASFSVGPDCLGAPASHPPDEEWIRSPSRWPAALPELRPAWEAIFRAQSALCESLLQLMAVALALPPDHFADSIDRPISAMRALDYPELVGTPTTGALRAGAHTDYGTLTILRTDDVPGLEIRPAGHQWMEPPALPRSFLINSGDMLKRWTNNRYRSTAHRARNTSDGDRYAVPFFFGARDDALIEALPTCVGPDDPARHEPITYGDYQRWFINRNYAKLTGRTANPEAP